MKTVRAARLLMLAGAASFLAACTVDSAGDQEPILTPTLGSVIGTAAAAGQNLPGATMILSKGTGNVGVLNTNAQGQFAFDNLAPGTYALQAETPAGYEFAPGETGFRSNIVVVAGQATSVNFSYRKKDLTNIVEVKVKALTFEPANVTIQAGQTVRWISDSPHFHTITMDNVGQAGGWNEAIVNSVGAQFEHTFTLANQTYPYNCAPHKTFGMVGTITVIP